MGRYAEPAAHVPRFSWHANSRRILQHGFAGRRHAIERSGRGRRRFAGAGIRRNQEPAGSCLQRGGAVTGRKAIGPSRRPDPGSRGRRAVRAQHQSARALGAKQSPRRACFSEQDLVAKIHPDDVAEWRRKVLRSTTTGGTYSHQYRIIRNDRPIWVRAKGQCILDKAGRPERFPGVVIDITATRRAS